ncbi:MAG: hypothetical protein HC905_22085 [Bacteroidales bacterium]|nr:hypothetical protein [Bacteroidales bacterium]
MKLIFSTLLISFTLQILAQPKMDMDSLNSSKAIERIVSSDKQIINNDTVTLKRESFSIIKLNINISDIQILPEFISGYIQK